MIIQPGLPLRLLAIAPYEALKIALLREAEAFSDVRLDVYTGDLEEGVKIVRRVGEEETFDAVLSRGGTAELIRPVTNLPVIEIPVSVYDVLRTIKLSENYTDRCAIVGFPGVTGNAHTLCNLLRKDIPIKTVNDAQGVEDALEELKAQDIRTVICDMVSHRVARAKGMNAMLITSGESSLHQALKEAVEQGTTFRRIRMENQFLRGILSQDSRRCVVFNEAQETVFSFSQNVSSDLLTAMRRHIPSVPREGEMVFYYQSGGALHTVAASSFQIQENRYYLFQDQPEKIPLRAARPGIQSYEPAECESLFMSSFFSISGSLGELERRLTPIAAENHPVLIVGEGGTGKEQIARALYLRSRLRNHPFLMVDGARLTARGWDFLLESHASPLSARGSAVYFQHMEEAPPQRRKALLSLIEETELARRLWLIFSCDVEEGMPLDDYFQSLSLRLGTITLHMPTLRSRRDEIPALASLYLGSLNVELGKQVSGFDPGALEMLIRYDWPGNYTQFKHVLHELAVLTDGLYISSEDVAEILSLERRQHRRTQAMEGAASYAGQTLEEITRHIVGQALAENGGNQSLTARQLGISRTTLWRMLSQEENFTKSK